MLLCIVGKKKKNTVSFVQLTCKQQQSPSEQRVAPEPEVAAMLIILNKFSDDKRYFINGVLVGNPALQKLMCPCLPCLGDTNREISEVAWVLVSSNSLGLIF